jgi:kumamolisin
MAEVLNLTLVLRPPAAAAAIGEQLLAGTYSPGELTPSDLAADSTEIQAVTDFVANHSLDVDSIDPVARTIRVSGSAADVEKAFGLPTDSLKSLDYHGAVNLPAPLNRMVMAVLGLNQTPIAKPHTAS